jgi:hypothetical protein
MRYHIQRVTVNVCSKQRNIFFQFDTNGIPKTGFEESGHTFLVHMIPTFVKKRDDRLTMRDIPNIK